MAIDNLVSCKLHLGSEWRGEACQNEGFQPGESSFHIGDVATSARHQFEYFGSGHGVSQRANSEMDTPGQLVERQVWQRALEGRIKALSHGFELLTIEPGRKVARLGINAADQRNEFVGVAADQFQDGAQEGVHYAFERYGGTAGFSLIRVKKGEALGVHRAHAPADHGLDERLLGLEVVVNGRQVDARFGGDGAQGGGLEAVAGEEALGGIEDPILGIHTFVSIIRMQQEMSRVTVCCTISEKPDYGDLAVMSGVLVTGSCGLVGSDVTRSFARLGFSVTGIDDNHRAVFFGPEGDTSWVLNQLQSEIPAYRHAAIDIRDREAVLALMETLKPDLIIHTAAQPSHDRAAAIPFLDFEVNALGTLHLLEAARRFCPESPFIHMSTNKVYGDRPNTLQLAELETRWDFADPAFEHGIAEDFSIDQSKHSIFGASKVAADVMVQEYGRYFGMPTCCLRGGCLTGPNHAGVELHGFLSYLVKCNVEGREYKVNGFKGKQVRDNLHSEDVATFMYEFWKSPRVAEVYNLGGGKSNSCSVLEAFRMAEDVTGAKMNWRYTDENRIGDHICYYSDLRKMQAHYPNWKIVKTLPMIFEEIAASWKQRLAGIVA